MSINSRTIHVIFITVLTGAIGGLSWMFIEMFYYWRKEMSLMGFCNGAIAGLVCITPACGFVDLPYAFIFGILGKYFCYPTNNSKFINFFFNR